MHNIPQLRPLSIGDLFDAAFQLYRRHFWTLSAIAALAYVPTALLSWLLWMTVFERSLAGMFSPFRLFGLYTGSFMSSALWSLTIGNLLQGALINAIAQSYLGQPITSIAAYRFGLRRYVMLVPASILSLIIVGISQVIPSFFGLIFGFSGLSRLFLIGAVPPLQSYIGAGALVLFCLVVLLIAELALLALLAPQAVILESLGPLAAIRRSRDLVRGSVRRGLVIVIAAGILGFLLSTVPSMLGSMLLVWSAGANGMLLGLLFSSALLVGQIVLQPLLVAIYTMFYYDQRVRKEGYDLELLAQGMTPS